jgi:N-acetyl-gamma-glutamyl-phosphate reductase
LCLPDAAAVEAVGMITNPDTCVIDTSTAHRTADGWTYGFAELTGYDEVKISKRIANPGCHASGFVALVAPLIREGIVSKDEMLSAFSLTGYSGGGKKMIAEYEAPEGAPELYSAPRVYGLTQKHKHLPEMKKICGLKFAPVFCPTVAPYYAGMEVLVPLFDRDPEQVKSVYRSYYKDNGLVRFEENADENGFASASKFAGRDDMEITVFGNTERLVHAARFDNLGEGASGAAIQNMNIIIGVDEKTGLSF